MSKWKGIVNQSFSPDKFEIYVNRLSFSGWRPSFCVLHATGIPTLAQWGSVPIRTRMINLEHFYKDVKGWSAGPHLFVDRTKITVFSPLTHPGVHSPSWNSVSWGIEMVGNFTLEPFDHQVRDNSVAAIAILCARLGLDSSTLKFHMDDPRTSHKSCPGSHVNKQDMIQRVHDEIMSRHPGDHLQDRPVK